MTEVGDEFDLGAAETEPSVVEENIEDQLKQFGNTNRSRPPRRSMDSILPSTAIGESSARAKAAKLNSSTMPGRGETLTIKMGRE